MFVQRYLKSGKTLKDLESELAIVSCNHPALPLTILNYSQIESPKTNPIVMECRSLVIETGTWDIVSRKMLRFFNVGEAVEITSKFNWEDYTAFHKEDGSLVGLFNYRDTWHMTTRGSWGKFPMSDEHNFSWESLFWETLGKTQEQLDYALNPNYTYVFELCSPYNQVVLFHPEPKLVLLDVVRCDNQFITGKFDGHRQVVSMFAAQLGVSTPKVYKIDAKDPAALKLIVDSMGEDEGLVCQDKTGLRVKCKNLKYLAKAALKNNNNFYMKDIYDWVIRGDEEILSAFPVIKPKWEKLLRLIISTKENLNKVYEKLRKIADQKEFAIALNNEKPAMLWVLFECRRHNISIGDVFTSSGYYDKVKRGILELVKES